ncbi:MAG TPA: ATPase domain-containing protein [Gemmatimonadales bacterium]|nr:ATPase domain-containing protein [Gemmatimonadales bacterium]
MMAKAKTRKPAAPTRPILPLLDTGVPGLNEVLGGGIPELSFNIIAGDPGAGKTTLAMQVLFATASHERPGLFISLLGETPIKMLRYQQLFGFFDRGRLGSDIHLLDLSEDALEGDLERVLLRIITEVNRLRPQVVVVDSFRSLLHSPTPSAPAAEIEKFIQRLAQHLTTWEVTSFLIGEYRSNEARDAVFTVADGILWMSQEMNRNSVVRRLQVLKVRGMNSMPGLHTMRISTAGVQVFPRIPQRTRDVRSRGQERLSTGVAGLDELMGGGIPNGDSLVLAGPTGTGKTTFAMQFVAAGLEAGEAAVITIFEEHPDAYVERARSLGLDLAAAVKAGKLRIIYLRPLDLSVDETLDEIRTAVREVGAQRVVIDSISGFEIALAPAFRVDFRESLYRLVGALTGLGVTIFSTVEVVDTKGHGTELQLTGYRLSFLTDDIISLRYVELEGELRKALMVVKMRGSDHSREFRTYEIGENGVNLRASLRAYDGILTGMPVRQDRLPIPSHAGLLDQETEVLEMVSSSGAVTAGAVAKQAGLPPTEVTPILERLLQLGYIERSGSKYQAAARARGD